jgi:hypothetical protein
MHGTVAITQMNDSRQKSALPGRYLVVTGIIAYTDPKQGFAMIGNSVGNTMLARPGQQLPDGAWIREIHPKNVVLEHGGNLESVGIYRRDESAGTADPENYPLPQQAPLPQLARWEQPEETAVDHTEPSQAPPTDAPSSPLVPGETLQRETPVNEARSIDTPPDEAASENASPQQARPDAPLPATPDPADEFRDDRRQRAQTCDKQSTSS